MIEKSMNPAPQGISQVDPNAEPLEIEIVDPKEVTLRHGDEEITIEPLNIGFTDNLAEDVPDNVLASLATDLIADFESDVSARRDWIQTYTDGLELLGLRLTERSEPWEGACAIQHPLLTEAIVKFQAETITATFPASGPVKTQIIGKERV